MTDAKLNQSIYHLSKENTWTSVSWCKVKKTIETLQHRITKATERGDYRAVRNLQRLLNRSLSARLKAVQIVAQENSGKKTPGIDGEIWTTSERKHQAAFELRKRSKTKPLKRVSNENQRSLDIPCMSDRARQALWNMSLLPSVEAISDRHSYGFRSYHECWHVNAQIRHLLEKPTSPTWILNAEIEKGFDTINHDWLLENTPMEKKVLKSWLKAGSLERDRLFPPFALPLCPRFLPLSFALEKTEERQEQREETQGESKGKTKTEKATLQGLSLTLANLTLNGLEAHLKKRFKAKLVLCQTEKRFTRKVTCIHIVRYAEGFIVTGRSKHQLERVKLAIKEFLSPRGLKMNEEKLSIRHISKGFDFLGWNFRKYANDILLCKISKQSIAKHRKEMKILTKKIQDPVILIFQLNAKIRDWTNAHYCCNGIGKIGGFMNQYLYRCLIKWGCKRHSNKTPKWVFNNYWRHMNGRWTFFTFVPSKANSIKDESLTLLSYNFTQKTHSDKG